MLKRTKIALSLGLLFVCAQQLQAQSGSPNPYSKSFKLSVGAINIGDVVISFEDMMKLEPISVVPQLTLSSPSSSLLPPGVIPYSIPGLGLSLFITIQTETAFRGPALVALRVKLLEYDPGIPLRFYAASGTRGSLYRDITASAGKGSMSTSGYRKGFSEFLLALDTRDLARSIDAKFADLTSLLNSNAAAIAPYRLDELREYLRLSHDAWNARSVAESISYLRAFILSVRTGAMLGEIPFSHNDPTNPYGNVGGELIAYSETTSFSLNLAR